MAGLTSAPQMRRTQGRSTALAGLAALSLAIFGPVMAQEQARRAPVVAIKPDRIILMDIEKAGDRLVCVGERGFALLSDDAGKSWKAVPTPVTRTLTSVAFKDDKVGIAVGHGASVVRTEDAGSTGLASPSTTQAPTHCSVSLISTAITSSLTARSECCSIRPTPAGRGRVAP
jgi:photosystem II stability/assembly factor-like uncharacterized protein